MERQSSGTVYVYICTCHLLLYVQVRTYKFQINKSSKMADNSPWAQLVCISEEDGLIIPLANDVFSVGRAKGKI